MAPPGLTDIQKSDLRQIWSLHVSQIYDDGSSNGSSANDSTRMDDRTAGFIACLTAFFIVTVSSYNQSALQPPSSETELQCSTFPLTFESIESLFYASPIESSQQTNHRPFKRQLFRLAPRLARGRRHVIQLDHASFLQDLESFLAQQYSTEAPPNFGAFLYHMPQWGLAATNCSIALMLATLVRRASPMTLTNPSDDSPLPQRSSTSTTQQQPSNPYSASASNNAAISIATITVRFQNVYPTIQLSDVKTSNAHKLLSLRGRIIKVHPKRLRLLKADVLCLKCGLQFQHTFQSGRYDLPSSCPGINERNGRQCPSLKFDLVRRTASYVDCQKLKLQEEDNGSSVTAGRTPRHLDMEVTRDLVDTCCAGDVVKVVGVIHAVNSAVVSGRAGKRAEENSTYSLFLVANGIVNATAEMHESKKRKGVHSDKDGQRKKKGLAFSEEQLAKITKVAHADHRVGSLSVRMAFPFDLIVRSLCPSIIGHDMVKAGILLALLGGTPPSSSGLEDVRSGISIRSNIHCLIVGDPGMGKSQMLLAATQVAARSIYVGGNTSSTTGLTVSLSKEAGGEVGIEAGALVLADQGVCCIDEFDKMAKSNQDGLLEAMEQQQISIAKAGVVASLPARCCIIAAANPKKGKYNMSRSVAENLNIASPLLSRFDLCFILRDEADQDQDKLVSGNIMNHYRNNEGRPGVDKNNLHSSSTGGAGTSVVANENWVNTNQNSIKERLTWVAATQKPLPADMVKDYISYAREYCKPKLTQEAASVLKAFFMSLRYPDDGTSRNDNVPITTRQLEALIRLAQARAKACLREFVLKEDAEDVVELMRDSVHQIHMDGNGNLDRTRGGAGGKSKRKQKKAFIDCLKKMPQTSFSKDDFYRLAAKLDLPLCDFWSLVDELRYCEEPELRKGPDGLYYVNH